MKFPFLHLISLVFFSLILSNGIAQIDTVHYHPGPSTYGVTELENGKLEYHYGVADSNGTFVNSKIEKKEYDKIIKSSEDFTNCCPCYLLWYRADGTLKREGEFCNECPTGNRIEYRIDNSINYTGNYKRLESNESCSVKHGQFDYYDSSGNTIYSEIWKNGNFISQVPVQDSCEVWKIEVSLNGKVFNDSTKINREDVKNLVFTPKYKNNNHNDRIAIGIEISAIGYKQYDKWYRDFNFNELDLIELHQIAEIPIEETNHYSLRLYAEENFIEFLHIKIK